MTYEQARIQALEKALAIKTAEVDTLHKTLVMYYKQDSMIRTTVFQKNVQKLLFVTNK